ncbi:DUF2796 domain-containing protein [Dyella silvatica]|uniref:DUF2796 domain-containing protein n=1 Tax=Dyella silvatica TaxID=2992128 RepID=UPI002258FBD3|nr:DUF2796 domain-containing protein [Dyella silvatica]
MMKWTSTACILGLGLSVLAASSTQARAWRQYGPHVHGVSNLDVVLEGSALEIALAAPGHNMVGFEHPPATPAEHQRLDAALALLKSPASWLIPARDGACSLLEAKVEPHGYDRGDQPADGGNDHTEIHAHYRYHCQLPAQLKQLEVNLLEHFPETREVVVNLVLPSRQDQQILQAGQHRVDLMP